jgi:multidrug efflux system membrane fusion protein
MKYVKAVIYVVIVILILGGFLYWSLRRMIPSNTAQPPAPAVEVATPVIQDVVTYNDFTGNLASVESVEIRARVEGYLRQVAFEDGGFVKKGDLLFEIEPEDYKAERDRALANLESARADFERAQQDYERVQQAVKSNAVSKQEVSTYKAQRDMAEAAVIAAKAALDQAELDLSYTRIESPIDGKISRNYVDAGNLVGAGENTLLARVVKLDPIYVYFNASESEYLDYIKDVRGHLAQEPNQLPLYLSLANKEDYAYQGHLDYMDNMVDPQTGTIQIRGIIPNPDYELYPGMFIRIRIPTQTIPNAVLVQQKAIGTDIGGKYLLVVDADNIVRHRPVELGARRGLLQIVTSGLSPGDTYIVSGLQSVYPGTEVTPIPEGSQPPPAAQPQNTAETTEETPSTDAQ